ncbi:BRCA2 and CDKN1A-interacting protein [Larus michahellis]
MTFPSSRLEASAALRPPRTRRRRSPGPCRGSRPHQAGPTALPRALPRISAPPALTRAQGRQPGRPERAPRLPAGRCLRPGLPAAERLRRRGSMATPAKRRARPQPPAEESGSDSEPESEPESESNSEEEEERIDEEVNIEFEAHSISDNDYNGIKKLLQQLFLKAPVNTAELTDILIQQNHIGSIIKQAEVQEDSSDDDEDDDEVFGFISCLNLTERKGTQCAEQIKELILSRCEKSCEQHVVEQLNKLLNDSTKPVGLLLSERFINVPPQIALPMHQQLQKELTEAQRTNKPCGKCHYYLLISKTFTEATKSSSKRREGRNQQKEELMFANAEEEFFYEKALLKFNYSVQEESDTCLGGRWSFDDVPMKPLRTVMIVPADGINDIMDKLKDYLSL